MALKKLDVWVKLDLSSTRYGSVMSSCKLDDLLSSCTKHQCNQSLDYVDITVTFTYLKLFFIKKTNNSCIMVLCDR
jgi:hypothetical protein